MAKEELETRCNELFLQTCEQATNIERLKEENAELKDNFKIAKDNEYEYSSLLTKAKEILQLFIGVDGIDDFIEVRDKAEQFLNEVEK